MGFKLGGGGGSISSGFLQLIINSETETLGASEPPGAEASYPNSMLLFSRVLLPTF